MGIIQRQTISGSIFSYLGAIIGFITVGVLLPNVISTEENGVLKLLVSYSLLFARFSNLGFNGVINRLFPYFRDDKTNHHGFIVITIGVILTGFLLSMVLFYLLRPVIVEDSSDTSALFIEYIYYLIPLIFFTLLFDTLDNYNKVLFNAVMGIFLREFIQRLLVLIVIICFIFLPLSFRLFVILYVISICLPSLIILGYLANKGQLRSRYEKGFIDKNLARTMASVSLFGILGGFSGIIITNVDAIMINSMVDLDATGIYAITFYFGAVILIPSRSLLRISTPIVANAWKENDKDTLREVYYKSSLTQFITGSLIFIGIWGNINNVFEILPPEYEAGKYVILFIGLANLLDMAIGANGLLIGLSKFYRYQTYFIVVFGLFVIGTNLVLIPKFGIVGAALASLISKFLFNLIRFIFTLIKFRIQPYNYRFLLVILFSAIAYLTSWAIPVFSHFIIDIILRSTVILTVYTLLVYHFKISDEINQLIRSIFQKINIF